MESYDQTLPPAPPPEPVTKRDFIYILTGAAA